MSGRNETGIWLVGYFELLVKGLGAIHVLQTAKVWIPTTQPHWDDALQCLATIFACQKEPNNSTKGLENLLHRRLEGAINATELAVILEVQIFPVATICKIKYPAHSLCS